MDTKGECERLSRDLERQGRLTETHGHQGRLVQTVRGPRETRETDRHMDTKGDWERLSGDLERPGRLIETHGHQGRLGETVRGPRETRETERDTWTPRETGRDCLGT